MVWAVSCGRDKTGAKKVVVFPWDLAARMEERWPSVWLEDEKYR